VAPRVLATVLALPVLLGACGGGSSASGDGGPVQVAASFYPLQWVSAQIAGGRAEVTNLTPPGAEPHDLELGPREVAAVGEAELVVYLSGFQPAVDEAVAQEAPASFDVGPSARLDLTAAEDGDGDHEQESGEPSPDPHFWLDPTRLADVGDAVAERLGQVDPGNAAAYTRSAARVRSELEALDREINAGLATCASRHLVTGHTAFGYLAERYELNQVGISGLTPEGDPSPQDLADVTEFVRDNDVRTIYHETLVSPAVARTVAAESGARTAVLDPLEGLTDDATGGDYLAVMRANLQTLRHGQRCG
jgi:zinc transport system substrate-binding protein